MKNTSLIFALVSIIAAALLQQVSAESALSNLPTAEQRGQELYARRCAACHSIDYNGIGPAHKGVFSSTAGNVKNYNYSAALKSSKLVWTASNLDKWLADPEQLVPGQKMGFSVPDANERADLIAYLKSQSSK